MGVVIFRQFPSSPRAGRLLGTFSTLNNYQISLRLLCCRQGWEFAHRFSERIALFLHKNEQMIHSLKKTSNLLIYHERPERMAQARSFVLSNLSNLLMVAHFL